MEGDAVRIENAVVSFREGVALKGVSLTVPRGEFLGIIGPNGAGKTTLLTIINGLGHLTSGRVTVLGMVLNGRSHLELRKRVGYVAQAEPVDPRVPMSVRDVVMIGRVGRLGLLHGPGKRDRAVVGDALSLVEMKGLEKRPIGHLSGGQQQRVSIARCLAQEPDLLLLDEPTASLDWKAQTDILEIVRRIHDERHLTTLFVTHDLDALPHTCDRVVLMKAGMIVGEGAPAALINTETLSRLYDVPAGIVEERRPHMHGKGA